MFGMHPWWCLYGPAGKGHFSSCKEEGSFVKFGVAQTKLTVKTIDLYGWQMNLKIV